MDKPSAALAVILLSRKSREWLKQNDPKAFEQAVRALKDSGWRSPQTGLDIHGALAAAELSKGPSVVRVTTPED